MIENEVNNRKYIGQSINVKQRISAHKSRLKKGNHENDYLQKQVNKYGLDKFTFTILEYCDVDDLDNKEKHWISHYDTMNRSKGYNLETGGNEGKIVSESTRMKKMGKNNPMYGKRHSVDFVQMITDKNKGSSDKLTESNVVDIKLRLSEGFSQQLLAEEYNVTRSTINKINKCVNWYWVREDLNEKLLTISQRKKEKRDLEILRLWKDNLPMYKISDVVKCDVDTVRSVLKQSGIVLGDMLAERNEKIVNDYLNGTSKTDIENKYNVSRKVVNRVIFKYKSNANTEVNN